MFLFKLFSLSVPYEPGIMKESIEDNGPVFWREIFEDTPE
jgi:hypothetical protein